MVRTRRRTFAQKEHHAKAELIRLLCHEERPSTLIYHMAYLAIKKGKMGAAEQELFFIVDEMLAQQIPHYGTLFGGPLDPSKGQPINLEEMRESARQRKQGQLPPPPEPAQPLPPQPQRADIECAVCLVPFAQLKAQSVPLAVTSCGHAFCRPCIVRCSMCPTCRHYTSARTLTRLYL